MFDRRDFCGWRKIVSSRTLVRIDRYFSDHGIVICSVLLIMQEDLSLCRTFSLFLSFSPFSSTPFVSLESHFFVWIAAELNSGQCGRLLFTELDSECRLVDPGRTVTTWLLCLLARNESTCPNSQIRLFPLLRFPRKLFRFSRIKSNCINRQTVK